jgi:CubicO group peptidase (beta-lactamase class C family)
MTKAVTSVAILQLYENGQLSMDDPVSSYIPGFENPEVLTEFYPETGEYVSRPADTEITIHHLLTHTSGIAYGFSDEVFGQIYANHDIPDLGTEENKTVGKTVNALAELPIMHDPGESFTYGLNTDVLGRIVEIVSGMPLNEYFRENIFDPLEMDDTGFYLPGREDDLTTLYTNPDDEFQPYPVNPSGGVSPNFPVQGAMTYYSGGAGLTSTARDYYTFLQALLNGGTYSGYELLENDTWQLMTSNQIGGLDLEGNKFGYGLMITTEEGAEDGMRPPGSLSWGGAFQTTYWIDQANEMIVVMMTQVVPSPSREEFYDDFDRAVYNALETAE